MDRRTFISHSAVLAAGAFASVATEPKAYGIGAGCPKGFGNREMSAGELLHKLIVEEGVKPEEIAYVPMEKERLSLLRIQAPFLGPRDTWPPYFRTLHSICYNMFVKGGPQYRMMGPGDTLSFLISQPDYGRASAAMHDDEQGRLKCGSYEELWGSECRRNIYVDYGVFRWARFLVDQADLLEKALTTACFVDNIKIAILQGENPPLWYAAAKNLFRHTEQIIYLRSDA